MPPPARLHSGVHRVLPRCREASVGLTCALGSVRGPVQACTHICSSAMHSPRTRPPFSLPPPSPPSPTFLPDDPPRLSCDNTASVTSLWGYMQHHLFFFAIIHALVVDVPSGCFLTATIVATERLVSFSHCLSTAPRFWYALWEDVTCGTRLWLSGSFSSVGCLSVYGSRVSGYGSVHCVHYLFVFLI